VSALPLEQRFFTATELVEELERLHGRPIANERQLHHYRRNGVACPDGTRINLRARKFGRQFYFTLDDIEQFSRAVAEAQATPERHSQPSRPATSRSVARSSTPDRLARAEQILEAEGL
jgi:hypothetical protein